MLDLTSVLLCSHHGMRGPETTVNLQETHALLEQPLEVRSGTLRHWEPKE